jgi:hypothetical protein
MPTLRANNRPEIEGAGGPDRAEVRRRLALESERRARLGVPVAAGGVLYLLSGIIVSSALHGIPSVGVLQGVAPALRGEPAPLISPRAAEIKFQSHHSLDLMAASVLVGVAYAALALVLLFLLGATRLRRPETGPLARTLVILGASTVAVLNIVTQIVLAIQTHNFATGHDFSDRAVEAVTHNGIYTVFGILIPLAGIVLAAGMIITMVGSVRVGLLPRWIGMVGGVSAVLLLLPIEQLDVITAFWLVSVGILLLGRLPGGDPPAWASGEAVPWPSPADRAAAEGGRSGGRRSRGAQEEDVAPEPLPAGTSSRSRRRRKRK